MGCKLALICYNDAHHDPRIDLGAYKRGDVAFCVPDSHVLSEYEKNHQRYVILWLPQVPYAATRELFTEDDEGDPNKGLLGQARKRRFDLDSPSLPATLKRFIRRHGTERELRLDLSVEQVRALMVAKSPIEDPRIFK